MASMALAHASRADGYTEFYLSNLWSWTPTGVRRVYEYLDNLNLVGATRNYLPEHSLFRIRCRQSDKLFVMNNFRKLQGDIESEIDNLRSGVSGLDEWLSGQVEHNDVRLPHIVTDTSTTYDGSQSQVLELPHSGELDQDREMYLEVADEIRSFPTTIAWQCLQSRNRSFDMGFISYPAKKAIEQAHGVKMVYDYAQEVVLIGAPSSEAAALAENKLTALLQDHLRSKLRDVSSTVFHAFVGLEDERWTIDIREIGIINPTLAPSTIFDPWKFKVPEQYDIFLGDVFCLRGNHTKADGGPNALYSRFGPREQPVIGDRDLRNKSRLFTGMQVADRSALPMPLEDSVQVDRWRKEVAPISETSSNVAPAATPSSGHPLVDTTAAPHPHYASIIDENAPIPLDNNAPISLDDFASLNLEEHIASRESGHEPLSSRTQKSILDQDDPILQNPACTLQRAMKPTKRTILVQVPQPFELVKLPEETEHQKNEGGEFITSLKRLMRPMTMKYGIIRLRSEIGRFYAYDVPASGRAQNIGEYSESDGWTRHDLRRALKTGQSPDQPSFFTTALTCFGNEIDFIASMVDENTGEDMWKIKSKTAFLDFHFQAHPCGDNRYVSMVLVVNTEDYTWTIRKLGATQGVLYAHCLSQHWDFQVRLSHDRPLEWNAYWGDFAQALVDSLEVQRPKFGYRYKFAKHNGIIVVDARFRQVCRFQNQDQRTFLDITRTMPTKVEGDKEGYRTVMTDQGSGVFSQWFEASVSSVGLEEVLKENESMVPGDEAKWTVEDLAEKKLLQELGVAFNIVKKINGLGMQCDNHYAERQLPRMPAARRSPAKQGKGVFQY